MGDYSRQWQELVSKTVDEQAVYFLKVFVLEFQGTFEQVLDIAQQFKKFAPEGSNRAALSDLPEFEAHLFLEKRDETLTVRGLRENLKAEITLDKNHNVAFAEYLLWKYKHTLHDLFHPSGQPDPALVRALEEAIIEYQQVLATREARERKMAELEAIASKGGVRGMAAKNELEQMRAEDLLAQNKNELTTAAKKRRAQKAVEADDGSAAREQALREEQARLEEENRRKAEAEQRSREDSRARLKAKSSLWQ
jgi:hypothetical protein